MNMLKSLSQFFASRPNVDSAAKFSAASWKSVAALGLLGLSVTNVGCIGYARHAIPAERLPPELKACEKGCRVPVNFALLGQVPPREYVLQAGDVLGVYIKGVLPPEVSETPIISGVLTLQRDYYPPAGNVETPSVGAPLAISDNGTLPIPLIGDIVVAGLTVQQANDKVREELIEQKVVVNGREFIYIKLLRSRTKRVVVIREDAADSSPSLIAKEQYILSKRGSAVVVDLPAYEDDVLHALATSGGLPGTDAMNEVWVLRNQNLSPELQMQFTAPSEIDTAMMIEEHPVSATAKRLRLWTRPGECTPFVHSDILLEEGDVVYLRPRQQDVFYTGGLLPGGQVPLPRDHDIDILEAIAMANGSVGGPSGASGSRFQPISNNRSIVPPSRALIVRKMPNGDQIAIRVDLGQAMRDANQRVKIQPGDFVSLHFKGAELAANVALGAVNLNYVIPNN